MLALIFAILFQGTVHANPQFVLDPRIVEIQPAPKQFNLISVTPENLEKVSGSYFPVYSGKYFSVVWFVLPQAAGRRTDFDVNSVLTHQQKVIQRIEKKIEQLHSLIANYFPESISRVSRLIPFVIIISFEGDKTSLRGMFADGQITDLWLDFQSNANAVQKFSHCPVIRLSGDTFFSEDASETILHEYGHLLQLALRLDYLSPYSEAISDFFFQASHDFSGLFESSSSRDYRAFLLPITKDLSLSATERDEAKFSYRQASDQAVRDFTQVEKFQDIYDNFEFYWISGAVNHLLYQLSLAVPHEIITRAFLETIFEYGRLTIHANPAKLIEQFQATLNRIAPNQSQDISKIFTGLGWKSYKMVAEQIALSKKKNADGVSVVLEMRGRSPKSWLMSSFMVDGVPVAYTALAPLQNEIRFYSSRGCVPQTNCFCLVEGTSKLTFAATYKDRSGQVLETASTPVVLPRVGKNSCWSTQKY